MLGLGPTVPAPPPGVYRAARRRDLILRIFAPVGAPLAEGAFPKGLALGPVLLARRVRMSRGRLTAAPVEILVSLVAAEIERVGLLLLSSSASWGPEVVKLRVAAEVVVVDGGARRPRTPARRICCLGMLREKIVALGNGLKTPR